MDTKLCRRCSEEKGTTEFVRKASEADGLNSWCKACAKAYHAEWRARKREERRLAAPPPLPGKQCTKCAVRKDEEEFPARSSWCKACMSEYLKGYYRRTKQPAHYAEREALLAKGERRCTKCGVVKSLAEGFVQRSSNRTGFSSQCKACDADYQREHRDRIRGTDAYRLAKALKKARRRARESAAIERITPAQWEALREQYNHACAYCKQQVSPLEMDHVVSLARGGEHTMSNIVPACRSCNGRKHANSLEVFLGQAEEGQA